MPAARPTRKPKAPKPPAPKPAVATPAAAAPRPPAPRPARASKPVAETVGRSDKGSRDKAATAANITQAQQAEYAPPLAPDGMPLVMIEMSASELVPTGQYANISIGPARARVWIDPRQEEPLSPETLSGIARAANQLAEAIEVDVIAVQRNLVLESMQAQLSGGGGNSDGEKS